MPSCAHGPRVFSPPIGTCPCTPPPQPPLNPPTPPLFAAAVVGGARAQSPWLCRPRPSCAPVVPVSTTTRSALLPGTQCVGGWRGGWAAGAGAGKSAAASVPRTPPRHTWERGRGVWALPTVRLGPWRRWWARGGRPGGRWPTARGVWSGRAPQAARRSERPTPPPPRPHAPPSLTLGPPPPPALTAGGNTLPLRPPAQRIGRGRGGRPRTAGRQRRGDAPPSGAPHAPPTTGVVALWRSPPGGTAAFSAPPLSRPSPRPAARVPTLRLSTQCLVRWRTRCRRGGGTRCAVGGGGRCGAAGGAEEEAKEGGPVELPPVRTRTPPLGGGGGGGAEEAETTPPSPGVASVRGGGSAVAAASATPHAPRWRRRRVDWCRRWRTGWHWVGTGAGGLPLAVTADGVRCAPPPPKSRLAAVHRPLVGAARLRWGRVGARAVGGGGRPRRGRGGVSRRPWRAARRRQLRALAYPPPPPGCSRGAWPSSPPSHLSLFLRSPFTLRLSLPVVRRSRGAHRLEGDSPLALSRRPLTAAPP